MYLESFLMNLKHIWFIKTEQKLTKCWAKNWEELRKICIMHASRKLPMMNTMGAKTSSHAEMLQKCEGD